MGDGPSESQAGDDPATFNTETGARTDEGVGYGNINTTTEQALADDPSINPGLADLSAFGGYGGAFSTQSTAGDQSSKGDMTGGSSATFSPDGTKESQYSRDQVPNLARMGPINFDPYNMRGKINSIIDERDKQGLYTEVTKDQQGNITGAYNEGPAFGLGFMPNVTTYTGFGNNRGTTDDIGGDGGEPEIIRRRMADEVIPEEATPEISDDLALNYLQDPYYLYSGQGNLYQPYGYAQNTLVDLLRTRNLTQPQQRAANLGLFGNPGDLS